MYFLPVVFSILSVVCAAKEIVTDYPTLPDLWSAETIEPGAPGGGKGVESYLFNEKPSTEHPSAMWSNYTDCQRLIHVASGSNAKRYLLGCDAVNCCWEPQNGNQVQFQIPNVHYSNPKKSIDVYYQRANVTNFGENVEADEWSWSWEVKDVLSQDWRAYTIQCDECVGGVQLLQWQSRAMGSEWFAVEFKNYKGYDAMTEEGTEFSRGFDVPDICQKSNLLQCPSGLHDKYFPALTQQNEKCCQECEEGKEKYYSVPILNNHNCGESCIDPDEDWKYHLLEPELKRADSESPCLDKGFNDYVDTQLHSAGPIKIEVDIYTKPEKTNQLKGPSCGTCGTGYQTCCIGFAIDGYPCDCHLQENGSGRAGSNCGDCGTAFAACCIGYAADGYPCECDVM
jgi:hypothetical protein